LPVGGIKEKLLGAHRGNIKTVIIPKDNEKDLAEIPNNVLKALEIIFVENVDEVLKVALLPVDDAKEDVAYEKRDLISTRKQEEARIDAKKSGHDILNTAQVN